jgi:hypothetical protein
MPRHDSSDSRPPRPTGDDEEALFMQWVYDQITLRGTLIDTPHIRFERTTQGIIPILKPSRGGGTSSPLAQWFTGLYDAGVTYSAQQVAIFTPAGGQAGAYVCLIDGTVGVTPDTGSPWWFQWPTQSTGVWSA